MGVRSFTLGAVVLSPISQYTDSGVAEVGAGRPSCRLSHARATGTQLRLSHVALWAGVTGTTHGF